MKQKCLVSNSQGCPKPNEGGNLPRKQSQSKKIYSLNGKSLDQGKSSFNSVQKALSIETQISLDVIVSHMGLPSEE